jgi:hypothetical protein
VYVAFQGSDLALPPDLSFLLSFFSFELWRSLHIIVILHQSYLTINDDQYSPAKLIVTVSRVVRFS